jgi:D-glycero-alpha-D-manno-heptose 1-phosphate guanylyltransferase
MQAIILCGGKGSRLGCLYPDHPKILVPIAGRPFIEWQLDWLGRQGITDIHLAAGYKGEVLRKWIEIRSQESGVRSQVSGVGCQVPEVRGQASEGGNRVTRPVLSSTEGLSLAAYRISFSIEPAPLGTGGGLRFIGPWVRSDPFLVINGDSLVPHLDVHALLDAHCRGGNLVSVAVTRIERTGRYGTVEFGADDRITAFKEKEERERGWVNAGVYVVSKSTLQEIPAGCAVSIETESFPSLAARGLIAAMPCPPPLLDMGTPEGISAMEAYLRQQQR